MTERAPHPLQDRMDELYTSAALLSGALLMCDRLTAVDSDEHIRCELALLLEKTRESLLATIEALANSATEVGHD